MFQTKKYIRFYKGYLLQQVHNELRKNNAYSLKEVDALLKYHAQVLKSCSKMDYFEIMELIVWTFIFGDKIGLNLDFEKY